MQLGWWVVGLVLLISSAGHAEEPPAPEHRIGVDAMLTPLFGGHAVAARYEGQVKPGGYVLGRLALYRGYLIYDEGDGFDAPAATIGYRRYWEVFYLAAEAGVAGIRDRREYDVGRLVRGVEWSVLPVGSLGFGLKVRRYELGFSLTAPVGFVGVSLGFDFVTR